MDQASGQGIGTSGGSAGEAAAKRRVALIRPWGQREMPEGRARRFEGPMAPCYSGRVTSKARPRTL
jgi:hypothetical protein